MAEDHTTPPFPIEDPAQNPTTQTKTETKTETIETDSGTGKPRRQPGELFGMSGRFWVSIVAILGASYVVVLVVKSADIEPQAKALTIGGYLAMCGSIANTYLGQNSGPTKTKPS